jgi:sugar phosphate permease
VSEADRRDTSEEDVRTALLGPSGALSRLQFRLMGFGIGLALLVTLAPTWLTIRSRSRDELRLYSGISLLGLTPDSKSPMEALGTVLFLAYLLLALGFLLARPETGAPVLMGIAGLVVTIVVVANQPQGTIRQTVDWTGAPTVALGLWVLAVLVSIIALKKTRS